MTRQPDTKNTLSRLRKYLLPQPLPPRVEPASVPEDTSGKGRAATSSPPNPQTFHCRECRSEADWLPNGELWCATCQRALRTTDTVEGAASSERAQSASGGGLAIWSGDWFVGFGALGLAVLAVLYFTQLGPFAEADTGPCIVTATAGKLCGDDARDWCDVSDPLRGLDPVASDESQAVCDGIRE